MGTEMWPKDDPVKQTLGELQNELEYDRADAEWTKRPQKRILRPLRRDTKIALGMAIILAIGMVVAAATLFTHTFPSGTTGAHLSTQCATLTMGTPSVPVGSGTVRFNCGASTPAFASDGGGPVTPTFTLLPIYTGLSIVAPSAIGTACTTGTTITSGAPLTIASGSYDYCAAYAGAGALPGFSLQWSQ